MKKNYNMIKESFFSKFKNWLILIPMIPVAIGGIAKGLDIFRYDILKFPKNSEERYIQHMVRSHFIEGESSKSTTVEMENGSRIVIQVFKDGCVTMKRISKDGLAGGFKIIPEPRKEDDLSQNENRIVYAGQTEINLGSHRNDINYEEKIIDKRIIRKYNDGCILVGHIDKYGNVKNWEWIKYHHK